MAGLVQIKLCGKKPLVFTTQDVKRLRCDLHIVGALMGTLPRFPLQNAFFGLPLLLMPEETTLLIKKHFATWASDNTTWTFPNTPLEQCQYNTFEYLWQQGLYVTAALKFGGDYLAYPGDPMQCHSQYIVTARGDREEPLLPRDIISMGRLATNVKKTCVISAPDASNQGVEVFSVQWAGF